MSRAVPVVPSFPLGITGTGSQRRPGRASSLQKGSPRQRAGAQTRPRWASELQLQALELIWPGREARICTGCPARSARRVPPTQPRSALTCDDGINPLDNLPAIADPVSVGEPGPSALAREALLTDYASAQVSHVRWTGSTVARRPCAVPVLACGTGGTTGTAARAETRCGRGHIASQRYGVVLSIMGTSGAGLVA